MFFNLKEESLSNVICRDEHDTLDIYGLWLAVSVSMAREIALKGIPMKSFANIVVVIVVRYKNNAIYLMWIQLIQLLYLTFLTQLRRSVLALT